MNDVFDRNIKAILKKDIALGIKLFTMKEKGNIKYDVFIDENDNANINIIDIDNKSNPQAMYEGKPVDETLDKIKEMEEYQKYPYFLSLK